MRKMIIYGMVCYMFWTTLPVSAHAAPVTRTVFSDHSGKTEKPSIQKTLFGETEGRNVYQYTLNNGKGMVVKVINYGATIMDIITPDKNEVPGSVVLGFDTLSSYTSRSNSLMGAVVGRVANRIANKKFILDGKEYVLSSYIHGGVMGFHKRIWDIEEMISKREVALRLTYLSRDGEEGYPGNLQVTLIYTLTEKNELKINYTAYTDKPTPVVLTNHTYFNLSGGRENKILNTELTIQADQYLESKPDQIPTGRYLDVKETPYDFTSPKQIGKNIDNTKDSVGYDLTFILRKSINKLVPVVLAYDAASGRTLQVYTTEPGLVFYTGNWLSEKVKGRGGKPFTKHGAFCLETQHFPDSPNHSEFPDTILRPGQTFSSETVYRFSIRR
jgi:aldose 1-epimerase